MMRKVLAGSLSSLALLRHAVHLEEESDADALYLRALRLGGGAPAVPQGARAPPAVPPAPLDVPSINLSARGSTGGAGKASGTLLSGADAQYVAGSLRSVRVGAEQPLVTHVTLLEQVGSLGAEVAVVGISRGCDASVTEALAASLGVAARLDGRGLTWYLVSNETPQAVVEGLERRVKLEVPGVGEAGALPLIAVLDRMGTRAGNKWIMPPSKALQEEEPDGSAQALALACIPYPSEIEAFVAGVVAGKLEPTLLGEERQQPPAASLPASYVTQVTSSSWASTVLDPTQDVLLEAYLSNCPMCLCLAPRLAMAAEVAAKHFPPGVAVAVAAMNVDNNERSRAWMPSEAFPTLQLFNRSPAGGGKPGRATHKMGGPSCSHLAPGALPPHTQGSISPASAAASPPCIPSRDFTHPTAPGKMALPTVAELVAWMAENCSTPFDPRKLSVPAEAVRGSKARAPWAPLFFPPGEQAATPPASPPAGPPASPAPGTLPLAALLEDMDAECKVFEAGVFDSLFAGHVAELCQGAVSSAPIPAALAWPALLTAAAAHAEAQRKWIEAGRDIRQYSATEGPVPSLGGLPRFGGDREWVEKHLPQLQRNSEALKATTAVPAAAYGSADAAWAAMEAFSDQSFQCNARGVARAWMLDQEALRCIAAAVPMAAALAEEEKSRRK